MGADATRAAVSISWRGQAPKARPAAGRAVFDHDDDHVDDTPRDEPIGVKRKRDEPPARKVIPMSSPGDWREERKRRLGLLDKHVAGSSSAPRRDQVDATPERAFTEAQQQGLVVRSRPAASAPSEDASASPGTEECPPEPSAPEVSAPAPPADDDEAALRALLQGEALGTSSTSTRVISQPNEEAMFHHDVDTRPDEPTLQDYAAMPVEEFGAAMLRGMGWKDGSGVGRQRQGPVHAALAAKRSALLGLGAKERAPGPSPQGPPRRREQKYVPVVRPPGASHSRDVTPDRASRDSRDEKRHATRDSGDVRDERRRDDRYRDDRRGNRHWDEYRRGDRYRDDRHRDRHRGDRYREDRPRDDRYSESRHREARHRDGR